MDVVEAKKLIKQRWLEQWAIVGDGVPQVFDNAVRPEKVPAYVRFKVRMVQSEQTTIGSNPRYRRNGFIDMICYRQQGEGDLGLDTMATKCRKIFERKRFGPPGDESINCFVANFEEAVNEGQFYRMTVSVSMHFYGTDAD